MTCSWDTDGDGDCGRRYCPDCGIGRAVSSALEYHGLMVEWEAWFDRERPMWDMWTVFVGSSRG